MTRQMKYILRKSGLTFVELLVAILIFSIIIVSVYSAFNVGLTAYRKGEHVASLYQKIRLTLDSIALDLRNSYKFSDAESRFIVEDGKLTFYSLKRFHTQRNKTIFKICRIEYWIEADKLLRKLFVDKMAFSEDEGVVTDILLDDLSQVSFEFPYRAEEGGSLAWRDSWLEVDKIPLAIKIYLEIDDPKNEQPINLTKIISIPIGELGELKE